MNLCRPWPQGSRSGGMAEVANRVCCGGAYGGMRPPPSVLRKHQPLTSRRGAGRRCPSRREKRCGGRGEAVGDCVHTDKTFRAAAEIVQYGVSCIVRDAAVAGIQDPDPVRRENTNMKKGGATWRPPSRKSASARLRKRKPGGSSDKEGGQGDRSSYSRDQRSGGGTPPNSSPRCIRSSACPWA